jgi:hypothetical protein
MNIYSPFTDDEGNSVYLKGLQFSHLSRLVNVDEGYKIEYKETFNEDVKRKIPAIISSFANSDGGWLFIGVKDKTKVLSCIEKPRTDYDQTITQLLKQNVTPLPEFTSKFVINSDDENVGVLVEIVNPGRFTPYVSNGTVYVRNGSSSDPMKSDRAIIDLLYKRAENHEREIEDFCKRETSFPTTIKNNQRVLATPLINIYLKKLDGSDVCRPESFGDIAQIKNRILDSNTFRFRFVQYGMSSFIFRPIKIQPTGGVICTAISVFFDLSVKIHIPVANPKDISQAKQAVSLSHCGFSIGEEGMIIDGVSLLEQINHSMESVTSLLKSFDRHPSEYALCIEVENAENIILFFDCQGYCDYITEEGLCFHNNEYSRSQINYLLKEPKFSFWDIVTGTIISYVLADFGFEPARSARFFADTVRRRRPDLILDSESSETVENA